MIATFVHWDKVLGKWGRMLFVVVKRYGNCPTTRGYTRTDRIGMGDEASGGNRHSQSWKCGSCGEELSQSFHLPDGRRFFGAGSVSNYLVGAIPYTSL